MSTEYSVWFQAWQESRWRSYEASASNENYKNAPEVSLSWSSTYLASRDSFAGPSLYGCLVLTMKFPLFFLLALCISKAAAFGLYGCYERLLYWQAYQMDSGSKKQKIAKVCSNDPRTAQAVGPISGGRCNLRQFLYYITEDDEAREIIADKNKLKDVDLAKEKTALDEVASKLYKADLGTTYHPGRIYEGLTPRSQVNEIVDLVAA